MFKILENTVSSHSDVLLVIRNQYADAGKDPNCQDSPFIDSIKSSSYVGYFLEVSSSSVGKHLTILT